MNLDINKFENAYHKDTNLRNMINRLKERENHSLSTDSKELSKMVMDNNKLTDSDMAYMRLRYGTPLTISDNSYNECKHPFTPDSYKEVIEIDKRYSSVENTVGKLFIILAILFISATFSTVGVISEGTIGGMFIIGLLSMLVIWIMHVASLRNI